MQESNTEVREIIYKLAIYVPGVILGLSAKLSKINRDKKLTWGEAFFQTMVAFSAAWFVWFALEYSGHQKLSAPAAVICGRFGDEIIAFIWKWVKLAIHTALKSSK